MISITLTPKRRFIPVLAISIFISAALMTGCGEKNTSSSDEVDTQSQTTPAQTTSHAATLPVSLNELMVALINQAADPIWVAAWKNPQTDKDWRNLEYVAYQLEVGGELLKIPGTGPMDKTWTDDPKWQDFADQLSNAGSKALSAIEAKNVVAVGLAGDTIVEVCESCHIAFKPAIPTGNKFGELSPTE